MPVLKRKVGDIVLADGRPGIITRFWEYYPESVSWPYYVDILDGEAAQLYGEHELKDFPDKSSTDVWEAMAYSYWEKWRVTERQLDELRDKIRELIDDAFA